MALTLLFVWKLDTVLWCYIQKSKSGRLWCFHFIWYHSQELFACFELGLVTKVALYLLQSQLSSLHVTFPSENEWQKLKGKGFLQRIGMQYHWKNRNYKKWVILKQFLNLGNMTAAHTSWFSWSLIFICLFIYYWSPLLHLDASPKDNHITKDASKIYCQ